MTKYVIIERINGRYGYARLSEKLVELGLGEATEYYEGDDMVRPHLRFLDDQDALAYVLVFGGEVKEEIPFIVDKVLALS